MPDAYPAPKGTALGFDFGETRIGVAQGDAELGMAHPITTVTGVNYDAKFQAIERLVHEWQPRYLVVGLPVHIDGTEHELTLFVLLMIRRPPRPTPLPLYFLGHR